MANNFSSWVTLGPSVALQIVEVGDGTLLPVSPNVNAAVKSMGGGADIDLIGNADSSGSSVSETTTVVSFVLMHDGTEESVAACREYLQRSKTRHALLFWPSEERPTKVEIDGLSIGLVRSMDLRDALIVIRMLQSRHDLTGANVSNAFEILSNQLSEALTVRSADLIAVLQGSLPFQGLFLSFSNDMPLAEFDDAFQRVRRVLPDDVNLVWQNGGQQGSNEVDLCIAREIGCSEAHRPLDLLTT